MKKFPMIALPLVPYVFVALLSRLCRVESGLSADAFSIALWPYRGICALVFLPHMAYALVLARRKIAAQ